MRHMIINSLDGCILLMKSDVSGIVRQILILVDQDLLVILCAL